MGLQSIHEELQTLLETIITDGHVYPFPVYDGGDPEVQQNLFVKNGLFHFWEFNRESTKEAEEDQIGTHIFAPKHKILLKGWRAVVEAKNTVQTFQLLVESVAALFREERTKPQPLNATAFSIGAVNVDFVDNESVTGTFCHAVQLSITVVECIQV